MNLKYYLRGLGIGIVVSALIVGISAGSRTRDLSDEEIRQRAKELGMVEESGVLADEIPKQLEAEEAENTPVPTPVQTPKPLQEEEPKKDKEQQAAVTQSPTQTPDQEEESDMIQIVVKPGEGSYSVCRQLEEAGLVHSASAYDRYLYEKGYDKLIVASAHEIPKDADEEQIAKIITGRN